MKSNFRIDFVLTLLLLTLFLKFFAYVLFVFTLIFTLSNVYWWIAFKSIIQGYFTNTFTTYELRIHII